MSIIFFMLDLELSNRTWMLISSNKVQHLNKNIFIFYSNSSHYNLNSFKVWKNCKPPTAHITEHFKELSFGSFLFIAAADIGERAPSSGLPTRPSHSSQSNDEGAALLSCKAVEDNQSVHLWFIGSNLLIGSHFWVVSGVEKADEMHVSGSLANGRPLLFIYYYVLLIYLNLNYCSRANMPQQHLPSGAKFILVAFRHNFL